MTFWQGFIIQAMGSLGMVNEKAALQIQNLLICIEMLIASLAHFYIFPYHEWQEGYKSVKEKTIHIRDTLALRDFARDMKMMVTTWDVCSSPVNRTAVRTRSHSEDSPLSLGVQEEERKEREKERERGRERDFKDLKERDVDADADEGEHWILGSSTNFLRSANMGHGVVAFPSLIGDIETGGNSKAGRSLSSCVMENSLLPNDSLKARESNPVDGESNPGGGLDSYAYTHNPLCSSGPGNLYSDTIGKSRTSSQSLSSPFATLEGSKYLPVPLNTDRITRNSAGSHTSAPATRTRSTWGNRDSPPHIRDSSPNTAFPLPTSHISSGSTMQSIHPPLPLQSSGKICIQSQSQEKLQSAPSSNVFSNKVMINNKEEKTVSSMAKVLPTYDDSKREVWSWSVPGKLGHNLINANTGGHNSMAQESESNVQRGSLYQKLSSFEQENETNLNDYDDGISCSSLESSTKITNSDSDSDHDSYSPFQDNPGSIYDSACTAGEIKIRDMTDGTSVGLRQDEVEDEEEDDMSGCLLSVSSLKIGGKSTAIPDPSISLAPSLLPSEIPSSDLKNLEIDSNSSGYYPSNTYTNSNRNNSNDNGDKKTTNIKKLSADTDSGKTSAILSAVKEHQEVLVKEYSIPVAPDISLSQIAGPPIIVSLSHPTLPPPFLPPGSSRTVRSDLLNSQKESGGNGEGYSGDDYRDGERGSVSDYRENLVRFKKNDNDDDVEEEEEEVEKDMESIDSSSLFSTTSQDVALHSQSIAPALGLSLSLSHTIVPPNTVPPNLQNVELLETESV